MLTDDASFNRGIEGVKSLTSGLEGLIAKGLAIAGVTLGIKALFDAASNQGDMLFKADYVNLSVDALEAWTGVMAKAGGSADALINSLGSLNAAFVQMQTEGMAPDNKLFQDISQLGLSPQDEINKDSDARAKDILSAALDKMNAGTDSKTGKMNLDARMAMDIVNRLLGGAAGGLRADLYAYEMGTDIPTMYADAKSRGGFNKNRKGGEQGIAYVREIGNEASNIWGAFSSGVMKDLAPSLKKIADWMADPTNKANIQKVIDGMVKLAGALIDFLGSTIIMGLAEAMAIISGHPEVAQEMANSQGQAPWAKKTDSIVQTAADKFDDLWYGAGDFIKKMFTFGSSPAVGKGNVPLPPTQSPLDINLHVDSKGNQSLTGTITTPDGVKHILTQSDMLLQVH
jgi:hypothetical protein